MLRYLSPLSKTLLQEITGDITAFKNKKCLTTIYVWQNPEKKSTWRIINIKKETPKPKEDWFSLMFFRAYCESIITSVRFL